jgi:RNA polymerase sigma-70 factor (ECF subfamily)
LPTRWSLVQRAKADGEQGRRALSELCEAYYEPVLTFFRCTLRDADAARDSAHEFFSELLAGDRIGGAERERGRFRSYLLGAAKHFLSHQRAARGCLKRGGGADPLPLDGSQCGLIACVPDTSLLSPEDAYDLQWALTVVARAVESLRRECAGAGRGEFFEQVKPWLTGEADHGDQAAAAARLGMSPTALKVAVHRLRSRFRRLLKDEIAGTLDDPAHVGDEMHALFAALGGERMVNR